MNIEKTKKRGVLTIMIPERKEDHHSKTPIYATEMIAALKDSKFGRCQFRRTQDYVDFTGFDVAYFNPSDLDGSDMGAIAEQLMIDHGWWQATISCDYEKNIIHVTFYKNSVITDGHLPPERCARIPWKRPAKAILVSSDFDLEEYELDDVCFDNQRDEWMASYLHFAEELPPLSKFENVMACNRGYEASNIFHDNNDAFVVVFRRRKRK